MNCQPILTDTPGIFRCPICGLQNPRPIKKPFHAECGNQEKAKAILAPLLARLAEETNHLEIINHPARYAQAVQRWAAEDFPIRDPDDLAYILDVICPGCRHYQSGKCGCCGAKGQVIAAKAHMATEGCSAMRW